jgi:hypothetical protein
MNNHFGLTFSAHSYYGGIRFYNQGYPEPFDAATGAKMVMSINNGNVGIGTTTPIGMLHMFQPHNDHAYSILERSNNSYHAFRTFNPSGTITASNPKWLMGMKQSSSDFEIQTYDGINSLERFYIKTNGNVGIGSTNPLAKLHISGNGVIMDAGNDNHLSGDLIIQANTGGRTQTKGAQLEFAIPANTDGSNIWSQARILTVAGNTSNGNATGKMILGTRRYYNRLGTGSQWYYGDDLTIDGIGNIGIGITNPSSKLEVAGNIRQTLNTGNGDGYSQYDLGEHHIFSMTRQDNGLGLSAYNGIGFSTGATTAPSNNYKMYITSAGNVGIGTTNPTSTLTVAGDIQSRKVKVTVNAGADFVFEDSYDLKKLEDIQKYIQQHKHLPEIPAAKEMETKGIELGEMNIKLLQKIEELTLYLIELKKELDDLKKEQKLIQK